MYELKSLNQVHLSRLSPVMWRFGGTYPRKNQMAMPIRKAVGMGAYESPTIVSPRGEPIWSNTYRIGAAGALSRVRPFGPSAFSGDGDATYVTGSMLGDLAVYGAAGIALYFAVKFLTTPVEEEAPKRN